MENLRRLGGEAGVLAGIAMAWLFLGLVLVLPSAGLSLADQANPHRYIPFITKHQVMFWMINVLGGFVSAVLAAVLVLALGDRFRENAPASARIGTVFAVFGAAALAAAAVIRQVGFESLTRLYAANTNGGAIAFYGINGIVHSLVSLGEITMGLGVLLFGNVMLKIHRYAGTGFLSVAAGTAMVLAGFVSNVYLFMASFVGAIVWFVWSALTLRGEVGPALFRWGIAVRRNGRERRVA